MSKDFRHPQGNLIDGLEAAAAWLRARSFKDEQVIETTIYFFVTPEEFNDLAQTQETSGSKIRVRFPGKIEICCVKRS